MAKKKRKTKPARKLTERVNLRVTEEEYALLERASESDERIVEAISTVVAFSMLQSDRVEQKLLAIAESAQDAIIMIDDSGLAVHWNSASEKITGYSKMKTLKALK